METKRFDEGARDLFDTIREIGHGRIENLHIAGGVPQLTSKTNLFRRFRRGERVTAPTFIATSPNQKPHAQHVKLLATCASISDGFIIRIEIADGLPVHWSDP